jgi:hypothetical protein
MDFLKRGGGAPQATQPLETAHPLHINFLQRMVMQLDCKGSLMVANLRRMVMQLVCKGSLMVANEPTKNNIRSLAGDFGILNSEGFPQEVKCEARSQSA